MGVSERKEREKAELKQLILETATEMFVGEGYEKTSIRNIAEKIEYSPATIYLYYKDKNEIFFDIHDRGFQILFAEFQVLATINNPLERLYKMGEVFLKFSFENQAYYELMFMMDAPLECLDDTKEWHHGKKSYDLLQMTLQECIDQKLVKPQNIDVLTMSILSFVCGMVSLRIRHRFDMKFPQEQLPALFQQSLEMLLGLIKA
jgi:AcrR family transcriptional regulator